MCIVKVVCIIFLLVLFTSCEEQLDPTPTPAPTGNPTTEPTPPATPAPTTTPKITFEEFQGIETNGAFDWEHFIIDGNHFLALANCYNGSSYIINSKIFKWNGYTFTKFQDIETSGATDWEYFSIEGNHYLVVANYYTGSTYNISSGIYKWDDGNNQFTSYQNIDTSGAFDWEYFSIEDDHFLVVANSYNDSTKNINSVIYKWNGANFTLYQDIPTNGARKWSHFVLGGSHFLAVANYNNDSSYNISSRIYKWDTGTNLFQTFQDIPTNGADDLKFFSVEEQYFLVVSNIYNGSTHNINSRIYAWDPDEQEFGVYQTIATNGASNFEYFTINNEYFLAVANYNNDETHDIDSNIYKWDNSTRVFTKHQDIPTTGAVDWEYFAILDKHFLANANYREDSTYNILSKIYIVSD